ncbi:MAG: hypothetical protein IKH76_01685, partial [Clostridiales bacterium]|nr:hypothetical protein [Clostridiales bacterium]
MTKLLMCPLLKSFYHFWSITHIVYSASPNHDKTRKKVQESSPPTYVPSPKHESGHNRGSENPIKSQSEGQQLLDTGYKDGRQVYNITEKGDIVKFQPDGTPNNG